MYKGMDEAAAALVRGTGVSQGGSAGRAVGGLTADSDKDDEDTGEEEEGESEEHERESGDEDDEVDQGNDSVWYCSRGVS